VSKGLKEVLRDSIVVILCIAVVVWIALLTMPGLLSQPTPPPHPAPAMAQGPEVGEDGLEGGAALSQGQEEVDVAQTYVDAVTRVVIVVEAYYRLAIEAQEAEIAALRERIEALEKR